MHGRTLRSSHKVGDRYTSMVILKRLFHQVLSIDVSLCDIDTFSSQKSVSDGCSRECWLDYLLTPLFGGFYNIHCFSSGGGPKRSFRVTFLSTKEATGITVRFFAIQEALAKFVAGSGFCEPDCFFLELKWSSAIIYFRVVQEQFQPWISLKRASGLFSIILQLDSGRTSCLTGGISAKRSEGWWILEDFGGRNSEPWRVLHNL